MRTLRYMLAALLICAVPMGCAMPPTWWPTTKKQDLLSMRTAYSAAAKIITLYRVAGSFDTDEGKIIDDTADHLMEQMAKYEAAISLGLPTTEILAEFNRSLLKFVTKQMQGRDRYEKKGAQP